MTRIAQCLRCGVAVELVKVGKYTWRWLTDASDRASERCGDAPLHCTYGACT